MSIIRPLLGRLTQGCIFTCAKAENYPHCNVHGLVITARCDVEQDKYQILNYLPVVSLDDWLTVDGFDILYNRLSAESAGAMQSALREAGISPSIQFSLSPHEISANFFTEPFDNKAISAPAKKFNANLYRQELLSDIFSSRKTRKHELYAISEGSSTALIRELVLQRATGYCFIPSIYESGDESGYVILLREVKHLSRSAAAAVANGLEINVGASLANTYGLSFDHEAFAMPIGEISSPMVEHIMQMFSNLFGRIGVSDLPKTYVDEISKRRPEPWRKL